MHADRFSNLVGNVCGSCLDPDDNEARYHISHGADSQSIRVVRGGDESPWLRLPKSFESDDSQPNALFIRTRPHSLRRFWSGLVACFSISRP